MPYARTFRLPVALALVLLLFLAAWFARADASDAEEASEGLVAEHCSPGVPPFAGSRTLTTTTSDGHARSYVVRIPARLDRSEPAPVILLFHGLGSTGGSIIEMTRTAELADRSGAVLVAVTGTEEAFGRTGWSLTEPGFSADARAVTEVLEDVGQTVCLDASRTFAMGFSNGSVFAQKFACESDVDIAAVAAVAGPHLSENCRNTNVPLIYFHGTEDRVVKYDGGASSIGLLPAVDDGLLARAEANRCERRGPEVIFKEHVRRHWWTVCDRAAEVRAYLIDGGGHRWPGGDLPELRAGHGTLETDLDATSLSWRFFVRMARERAATEAVMPAMIEPVRFTVATPIPWNLVP